MPHGREIEREATLLFREFKMRWRKEGRRGMRSGLEEEERVDK